MDSLRTFMRETLNTTGTFYRAVSGLFASKSGMRTAISLIALASALLGWLRFGHVFSLVLIGFWAGMAVRGILEHFLPGEVTVIVRDVDHG